MIRFLTAAFVSLLLLMGVGCVSSSAPGTQDTANKLLSREFEKRPRGRIGSYATLTLGTYFMDPDQLGTHGYSFSLSEKNGIVYTCKAGHIDTYHLRDAADWTAYLAGKTLRHLVKNETEFSFKLKEDSMCFVRLSYPENWQTLRQEDKEAIAYDVSIRLGQSLAYTMSTWHEILTWFGYKCTGIFPEFPSAFSWEDTYSNLLGTYVGAMALRDTQHPFNQAVSLAISSELERLYVQPGSVARRASNQVKRLWFSGDLPFVVDIKKRNFNIGLADGFVTPCLVPSLRECACVQAQPYPVPNVELLRKYGFSARFEIEPREWERDKILSIVYPDKKTRKKRIEPARQFGVIMAAIRKQAEERYGPDVACSSTGQEQALTPHVDKTR